MSARQSAAVDRALALVAKGITPYAAAKATGIALTSIYRALKRQPADSPVTLAVAKLAKLRAKRK